MGQLDMSKTKKIQALLDKSAVSKKITSSVKTAYTKLGKQFNLKGTFGGSSECFHHIGYLAKRDSEAPIPDKCMTCKDLIECMNKVAEK